MQALALGLPRCTMRAMLLTSSSSSSSSSSSGASREPRSWRVSGTVGRRPAGDRIEAVRHESSVCVRAVSAAHALLHPRAAVGPWAVLIRGARAAAALRLAQRAHDGPQVTLPAARRASGDVAREARGKRGAAATGRLMSKARARVHGGGAGGGRVLQPFQHSTFSGKGSMHVCQRGASLTGGGGRRGQAV